jgi:Leucine-rich repeat (LRR) protein
LGNLSNLEELDVYGLQNLKQFPPSFSRLSRLKRLDVMRSGIAELQLTAEQWGNLEKLYMHGPLPDLRLCVNLKHFSWFKNNVGISILNGGVPYGTDKTISLPLSPLRQLESLSIHGGALDSNAFLASMANLRNLHLSCDFEHFPDGFEKLDKLEEINIWGAKSLTALPEYLGYMPSLKKLSLTGCGVKSLPKSVRERKNLVIDVSHCPVQWPE